MTSLPAAQVRPARLHEVRSPGILLQIAKYGWPLLVVGEENDPHAVVLEGNYKFRTFKPSPTDNQSGLAIENVEFELDLDSALDASGYGSVAGSMIRSGPFLSIAAISDDVFGRAIEIPILTNLSEGGANLRTAFYTWRAFVMVADQRRVVWECKIHIERDW